MQKTALTLLSRGLSVIPVRADKRPLGSWKSAQSKRPESFPASADYAAIVCGAVSMGAECLDIDLKYDTTGQLYSLLTAIIRTDLLSRLVIQKTPSGGYHFWYRCKTIEGNQKLANREDGEVLVETRGEGGYALIAPSKGYELVQGSFAELPFLSPEERTELLEAARSFDQSKQPEPTPPPKRPVPIQSDSDDITPWDAFNAAHTPAEILKANGWRIGQRRGDHVEVCRPGKTSFEKSGIATDRVAHIHTTSTQLDSGRNYTAFQLYAMFDHGGDFRAATKAAVSNGYGTPYKKKTAPVKATKTEQERIDAPTSTERPQQSDERPFQPLGFNKDESGSQAFYFYAYDSNTVIRLTASKISSKSNLLQLAPYQFWIDMFPAGRSGSFDATSAADYLVRESNKIGYYTDEKLRGRGAWLDGGKVTIHAGTHIIRDGKEMTLREVRDEAQYFYELGPELNISAERPLSTSEASRFVRLVEMLSFSRGKHDARLLAGWLACSTVCGVLPWRPHIWLTGAKGSGKSWTFENFVRRMSGDLAIGVQSDTTSAGLRQYIKNDALNIIFDEAEGENEESQRKMQNVMQLMRAASASDGGIVLKGSASGAAQTFRIRSCFAFASIVPQMLQAADKRRITVIELKPSKDAEKFKQIQAERLSMITDDYVKRFQARIITLLPELMKAIDIFNDVMVAELGSKSLADQVSPMLAGCFLLESDQAPTTDQARGYLKGLDFSDEQEQDSETDEELCIKHLLGSNIRVQGGLTYTVSELFEQVLGGRDEEDGITLKEAERSLKSRGFRVIRERSGAGFFAIANTMAFIKEALKGTPWARSHSRVLGRIDGCKKKVVNFGTGQSCRAVMVPLEFFETGDSDSGESGQAILPEFNGKPLPF